VTEARLNTISALNLHTWEMHSDALAEQAVHELKKQALYEIMPSDELAAHLPLC